MDATYTAADYARAVALLAAGDFAAGWPAYEARTTSIASRKPDLPFPEWRGEPLAGKSLLVWPEQGLGDKIMFARYLPFVDAKVSVLCEPALAPLFAANFRADVIVASGETEFPDPDVWCLYGSLPYRLGLTEIPNAPYLSGARAARRPSAGCIGVCVRGNPIHPNDANRSLCERSAERLMSIPGAVSLQFEDLGVSDLLETAKIIAGLDLVVTVDTAVAHLAGAMGKRAWVLLPAVGTDWRWGISGERSIWYPSARLIRQRQGEAWDDVVEAVCREIS